MHDGTVVVFLETIDDLIKLEKDMHLTVKDVYLGDEDRTIHINDKSDIRRKINDNGTISFENMKRMEARRAKVDETLLQAAKVQQMADHIDQLINEIMRQQRSHLNKQVYDLAERKGVSIYDICLQYMPQMSEPQFGHADDGTFTYEQDIRLVPMPFEPDKGPDYWKEECLRLKKRMLELINDKEE